MSLDIRITGKEETTKCTCPICGTEHESVKAEELFWLNVTHNLGDMAEAAGIYTCMWHPDELGITKAGQLVESLTLGLERLKSNPYRYKTFNPDNGWGSYDGLVIAVEKYLQACRDYPDGDIITWT